MQLWFISIVVFFCLDPISSSIDMKLKLFLEKHVLVILTEVIRTLVFVKCD